MANETTKDMFASIAKVKLDLVKHYLAMYIRNEISIEVSDNGTITIDKLTLKFSKYVDDHDPNATALAIIDELMNEIMHIDAKASIVGDPINGPDATIGYVTDDEEMLYYFAMALRTYSTTPIAKLDKDILEYAETIIKDHINS